MLTVCYRLSLSAGRGGLLRYAPRVRAMLASPCDLCCRSLQRGAANPTLLPVVSDNLISGRIVILYTVLASRTILMFGVVLLRAGVSAPPLV